mmetsp:Transcript_22084/g.63315  ORF Transcript_22084/g.63315 Transcript_22084/m.63315 type:complete len:220 (-) Transcript_22084:613-1272(-)
MDVVGSRKRSRSAGSSRDTARGERRREKDAILIHGPGCSDVGLGPGLHFDRGREVDLLLFVGINIATWQGGGCEIGADATNTTSPIILIPDTLVPALLLCLAQSLPVHGAAIKSIHVPLPETNVLAGLGQGEYCPSLDVGIDETVGVVHEEELDDLDRQAVLDGNVDRQHLLWAALARTAVGIGLHESPDGLGGSREEEGCMQRQHPPQDLGILDSTSR